MPSQRLHDTGARDTPYLLSTPPSSLLNFLNISQGPGHLCDTQQVSLRHLGPRKSLFSLSLTLSH